METETIKLVTQIDEYEQGCLTSLAASKAANQVMVEETIKQVDVFLTEKGNYLQEMHSTTKSISSLVASIQANKALKNDKKIELINSIQTVNELLIQTSIDEAIKIKETIGERKTRIKATMFNNKQMSFRENKLEEISLGEFEFKTLQMPYACLDLTTMKPLNI